jgi:hypothetical protein
MPKIAYEKTTMTETRLAVVNATNRIIRTYLKQGYRLTLRQLYYQFVARALIPNTQRSYKRLGDIINQGRLQGLIDWHAIEDRTRSLATLGTFTGPDDCLACAAQTFRIDRWERQPVRIEVWIEKEALAGVAARVCHLNRVPYLSCRGYTSQSEMWGASRRLTRWVKEGQRVVILHLGDHDPSGIDMSRDITRRLKRFMGKAWEAVTFKRVALNMAQVNLYSPPPNPAKVTDSRYAKYRKAFGGQSWELDALEPAVISELILREIRRHRVNKLWREDRQTERAHREQLKAAAARWNEVTQFLNGGNGDGHGNGETHPV